MCVITVPYRIQYFGLLGKCHVIKRNSVIAFEQYASTESSLFTAVIILYGRSISQVASPRLMILLTMEQIAVSFI